MGIEEKKKSKRPPKRLPEVTHNPRVPRPAPFLCQPSPTSCLCYGNSPPALLSASVSSCILGNAVHLRLPPRGISPLRVLKGLPVPEGCGKTPAVSGRCGLDREPEKPAGRPEESGEGAPNGRPPGRGQDRHWLRRRRGGGVSGMRRGAVRCSRC